MGSGARVACGSIGGRVSAPLPVGAAGCGARMADGCACRRVAGVWSCMSDKIEKMWPCRTKLKLKWTKNTQYFFESTPTSAIVTARYCWCCGPRHRVGTPSCCAPSTAIMSSSISSSHPSAASVSPPRPRTWAALCCGSASSASIPSAARGSSNPCGSSSSAASWHRRSPFIISPLPLSLAPAALSPPLPSPRRPCPSPPPGPLWHAPAQAHPVDNLVKKLRGKRGN